MFQEDLKRGLGSWVIWVSVAACALIMLFGTLNVWGQGVEYLINGKAVMVPFTPMAPFNNALSVIYIVPLICVLPLGIAFCLEWRRGFYRYFIPRIGWSRYALTRLASGALTGGLICMLPYLIFAVILYIMLPTSTYHMEEMTGFYSYGDNMYNGALKIWFPDGRESLVMYTYSQLAFKELYFIIIKLCRIFVFGACWSVCGLALSVWTDDSAITMILPVFIFMGISYLTRTIETIPISPRLYITEPMMRYPFWVVFVMPIIWGLCFAILYGWGIRRRIEHA